MVWALDLLSGGTGFKPSIFEGLPGVLGNKGTLAKYRREQGNISQFLGTGEQNSKNYSTKTFGKCVGTPDGNIRQFWKGTREQGPPLGDPQQSLSSLASMFQMYKKLYWCTGSYFH